MAQPQQDTNNEETADRDEIPPTQREKAKERDNYTCQFCDQKGPQAGGITPLQVHHKSYNPDSCNLHDLENLITLCVHCHHWQHSKPTPDTPSVEITEEAAADLIPVDFQIIELLHKDGPLTTAAITEQITPDKSQIAVEERLWRIMGIDTVVSDQSQLIDQDASSTKWGLPYQIETSERRIPDAVQEIVQRTIDALVASALERGCDRTTVTTIFNLHYRTTYRIQYRGQAHDFPLSMYTGQGRPREDGDTIAQPAAADTAEEPASQQQLDDLDGDSTNDTTDSTNTIGDDEAANDSELGSGETLPTTDSDEELAEHYETIDPTQPQIDGSNREWLIPADDYPEELRSTIHRLNIAKITYRERENPPVETDFDIE